MVFTLSSNEHTIKTLLNSRLATNKSVIYAPRFSLSNTIFSPHNMVSMVCLESCTILPPSMFSAAVMNDSTNFFTRRTLDGAGNYNEANDQDYWGTADAAVAYAQHAAADWDTATNVKAIRDFFKLAGNFDLTNMDMVAVFIFGFMNAMRCVSITLDSIPGDTEPCVLSWNDAVVNNQNVGIITTPASIFNIGGAAWGANPNVYPAFTPLLLSARLKLYQSINFTILADPKLNIGNTTAEFRLG